MYLFISNGEDTVEDKTEWEKFANSYIEDLENVKITKYDSSHSNIIEENYEDISTKIKEFIKSLD